MQEVDPNQKSKGGKWWIVLIIIVVVIIIVFLVFGLKGFGQFLSASFWAIIVGVILLVIGFAIYAVFFQKKKIDLVAVQAKKLRMSAHLCKPKSMNKVYLSGDRLHETIRLGKITGFCKVLNYDNVEENVITFRKLPFPLSLFEEEKIIRVDAKDMTSPVGDVYLYGLSLIRISEYNYLHKDMLNVTRIDYTILQEAKRGVLFLTLSDMKEIVDKAVDLDSRHQKELQANRFIPIPGGGNPPSPPDQ